MIWRILAASAFLGGGFLTFVILIIAKAYGASQAGMSAVSVRSQPHGELLITCLLCSYFAISAVGVLLCGKRRTRRSAAALAHFVLFATLAVIFVKNGIPNTERTSMAMLRFLFVCMMYFTPWFMLWIPFCTKPDWPGPLASA
jgi:hypothetical protein